MGKPTFAYYLRTQPESILDCEISSSFRSIRKTIEHIGDAEKFWMQIILKSNLEFELPSITNSSSSDFLDIFIETSNQFYQFINSFSESQLQIKIITPWLKEIVPIYDVVQHCFTHSSYHRGQLTSIFRQLKLINIPTVGYYEFLIHEQNNLR